MWPALSVAYQPPKVIEVRVVTTPERKWLKWDIFTVRDGQEDSSAYASWDYLGYLEILVELGYTLEKVGKMQWKATRNA